MASTKEGNEHSLIRHIFIPQNLALEPGRGSLAPTLLTHLYLQVFVSLVPKFWLSYTYKGGVGWGGDDNVQVRSKTDLSTDKTKGWGGVGWG